MHIIFSDLQCFKSDCLESEYSTHITDAPLSKIAKKGHKNAHKLRFIQLSDIIRDRDMHLTVQINVKMIISGYKQQLH